MTGSQSSQASLASSTEASGRREWEATVSIAFLSRLPSRLRQGTFRDLALSALHAVGRVGHMNGHGGWTNAAVVQPSPDPGGTSAALMTLEEVKAAVDRLREQMTQLDQRKERLMKARPAVRARGPEPLGTDAASLPRNAAPCLWLRLAFACTRRRRWSRVASAGTARPPAWNGCGGRPEALSAVLPV